MKMKLICERKLYKSEHGNESLANIYMHRPINQNTLKKKLNFMQNLKKKKKKNTITITWDYFRYAINKNAIKMEWKKIKKKNKIK